MKSRIFALVFITLLGFSCAEEEVIPRTNPRFSVASVQSIDESGVEFSANIFDLGSEEVLEYGFAIGKNPKVDDVDSEVVSKQGRPEREFRLKLEKGLKKGERYLVVAFLKTSNRTVYSEAKEFISQGSTGFILDQIIAPDEVYFGTELIFEMRNLPRNLSNIKVFFEGYESEIKEITENGLRILIPEIFEFDEFRARDNRFLIKISSKEKELEIEKILNFKMPQFDLDPNTKFDYSERLQIKGENLREINLLASYKNSEGTVYTLDVFQVSDELIEIRANALFTEERPKIHLKIRGVEYELDEPFSFNPTLIEPNQAEDFDGWYKDILIKGNNFNPHDPSFNQFVFDGSSYHALEIREISPTEIKATIVPQKGTYNRSFSIFSEMGPGKSQNSFQLHVITPELPYLELPYSFLNEINAHGVSYQDKGYFIGPSGIYEFSGEKEAPAKIFGELPFYSYAPIEFATAGEGKIFLSDGYRLFSFDIQKKQLEQLPDLPNSSSENLGFFVESGYLYSEFGALEGGFYQESAKKRFRLDLSSKVWQELPSQVSEPYFIFNNVFRVNSDIYVYRTAVTENDSEGRIDKFNPQSASWSLVTQTGMSYVPVWTNEVYVIDEMIIFPANANSFIWNINQNSFEFINNFKFGIRPKNGFKIKDKLYQFNQVGEETIMYQIDPSYFKFGR